MKEAAVTLHKVVREAYDKFRAMPLEGWEYRKAPGKWSRKEILGHLIDSAANNHQRFVRGQYGDKALISYDGDAWVKTQSYHLQDIHIMIGLWSTYNLHLVHVIAGIPDDKRTTLFSADADKPITLEWLVNDYVRHMQHHLSQILV